MQLSFLGPYPFMGVTGTPGLPMARIIADTRPGVNGTSLWRLGVWGKPCQIETVMPTINYALALQLWGSYAQAGLMNPLPMWLCGVPITGGKYQVMEVDAEPPYALVRFNVPDDPICYQGAVRAKWTLMPVADFV